MKRVVSSSFITLLIIVAVAATFFYLKNYRNQGGDPIVAIPADAVFVISTDPSSQKSGELLSMDCWQALKSAPLFADVQKQLIFFDTSFHNNTSAADFLKGQPLLLSGHVTGAGKFDLLFLKSLDNGYNESSTDDLIKMVAGSKMEFVKRNYDGNIIRELALENGKIFSFVTAKGIFIASFTPFLVEDALRQLKLGRPVITDEGLLQELRSTGKASICINFKNLPLFTGLFLEPALSPGIDHIKSYADWGIAMIQPQKNKLQFTGFFNETDSLQFVTCFKGQKPVDKMLIRILPRKTAVINYVGTSEFRTFYKKLSDQYISESAHTKKVQLLNSIYAKFKLKIEDKMIEWIGNEYALIITEPAGLNYENNSFAVFRAKNIAIAKKSLTTISRVIDKKSNTPTLEESYNGHSIGFVRLNGVIPAMFGATFSKVTKMYYTDIEDYIIFANQASAIRSFIDEYKSGLLLHKTDFFQAANSSHPAKGNHFIFVRPPLASRIFKSVANAEWKKYTDQYKDIFTGISSYSFQMTIGDTLPKLSSSIDFFIDKSAESVDLVFSVETDTTVSMRPLVTTDPVTKTRQLLFQDDALNLYLTDNSGNILWKQQVAGKIIGDIFEIDLFKNNTRQFLFNTKDYLFLVDTKGSPVGNYPIRLPAVATNGVAVFDFDKNEEVKIYVACENRRIYAYQPSGKPLPGWNFESNLDIVKTPVRTVAINGKNILIITDRTGVMAFVNRYGELGVQISKEFSQAQNSGIYTMKSGSLVTTDIAGNVIEIHPDGSVESKVISTFSTEHGFLYADADGNKEPDFIFIDGKVLSAYSSTMTLIFKKEFEHSMNGPIQLYTLGNGEHVMGVCSKEADQVWLVKMDGTLYNGFPVKGSTAPVIDELNMDGKKHLITSGRDHLVYVYSID